MSSKGKKKSLVRSFEREIRVKQLLHAGIIQKAGEIPTGSIPVALDVIHSWKGSYSLAHKKPYYQDASFVCENCKKSFVWTAQQQRHWFEVLHGSPYSKATRCSECRKKLKSQQ